MKMEKWKQVKYKGFERYQISDKGNVKGTKGLMKSRPNSRKYHIIGLREPGSREQKTFSVHRMVAEHFRPQPS